jgi:hypothetical protein
MRSIWLIFGFLVLVLLGLRFGLPRPAGPPKASQETAATPIVLVSSRSASQPLNGPGQRDSIVRFALRQMGTPYVWAGTSPLTGFDCSGFISYVFGHFGVATPHSTALLIDAGRPVLRAQAQPGDIVVFTGTAEGSTTPGHAGIVISAFGETPLRFVHASSARRESGVKVSQVENSGYERRFMQVRRVLDGGTTSALAASASRPATTRLPTRPAGAVAPLPAAAPKIAADLAVALPARVAPVPVRIHSRARVSRVSAKKPVLAKRRALTKHIAAKKPAIGKVTAKKPANKKVVKAARRPKEVRHSAKPKSR